MGEPHTLEPTSHLLLLEPSTPSGVCLQLAQQPLQPSDHGLCAPAIQHKWDTTHAQALLIISNPQMGAERQQHTLPLPSPALFRPSAKDPLASDEVYHPMGQHCKEERTRRKFVVKFERQAMVGGVSGSGEPSRDGAAAPKSSLRPIASPEDTAPSAPEAAPPSASFGAAAAAAACTVGCSRALHGELGMRAATLTSKSRSPRVLLPPCGELLSSARFRSGVIPLAWLAGSTVLAGRTVRLRLGDHIERLVPLTPAPARVVHRLRMSHTGLVPELLLARGRCWVRVGWDCMLSLPVEHSPSRQSALLAAPIRDRVHHTS